MDGHDTPASSCGRIMSADCTVERKEYCRGFFTDDINQYKAGEGWYQGTAAAHDAVESSCIYEFNLGEKKSQMKRKAYLRYKQNSQTHHCRMRRGLTLRLQHPSQLSLWAS